MYFSLMNNLLFNINLDAVNRDIQFKKEPLYFKPTKYFVGEPVEVDNKFGYISKINYSNDNSISSIDVKFRKETKNYSFESIKNFNRIKFTIGSTKIIEKMFKNSYKSIKERNSIKEKQTKITKKNSDDCLIF